MIVFSKGVMQIIQFIVSKKFSCNFLSFHFSLSRELQLHRQSIREFLDRSVEEPNPRSSRLVLAIAEYIKDSLKTPGTASASAPTSPAKLTGNLKRLQPISAKKQQQKSPIKRS